MDQYPEARDKQQILVPVVRELEVPKVIISVHLGTLPFSLVPNNHEVVILVSYVEFDIYCELKCNVDFPFAT